jgi:phenylacetate-coenzyme A ligase PaaK-like adenylate-forming protein
MRNQIFTIQNKEDFRAMALKVFDFQYKNCKIYRQYVDMLHVETDKIKDIEQIPFLPIEFFKTQQIIAEGKSPQICFTSSGTTSTQTSTHFVADKTLYEESFLLGFQHFVGNPEDYAILALLPSYLERENSSLVYMVNELIIQSKTSDSGFYLTDIERFANKIKQLDAEGRKILVFGVSFALLDVVEQYQFNAKNLIVFETGGMKNRRKEIAREELHSKVQVGFGVETICSEYGMTELLSQAYSTNGKTFNAPPWMQIVIRDPQDPLSIVNQPNQRGGINVIDLANLYSCSFIATEDLGKIAPDGSFEVLGRMQNADLRGCNMLL